MNSEELEKSLKTEFESHLKEVLAKMQQDLNGFQEKFETEIESHKTRLSEVLKDFSARFDTNEELDEVFRESVVEHLRLARDEGARITAEALTEAEEMQKDSAPAVSFNELRDAINEISSQSSQAEILKSLVNHAAQYVSRGAFFIVKNEHFVGWRVFGKEADMDDKAVREVYFPVSASTVLGQSARSLATVESSFGTYDDDAFYLEKLEFGQPDRMYALPLVARGRGVAVLYADYGKEGTTVNIEALETMMRVAGLTVELLAASRGVKNRPEDAVQTSETSQMDYSEPQSAQSFTPIPVVEDKASEEFDTESEPAEDYSYEQPQTENYNNYQFESKSADEYETAASSYADNREDESVEAKTNDYQFESDNSVAETQEKEDSVSSYDYSTPSYDYSKSSTEESQSTYSIEEEVEEPQTVSQESDWNKTVETNGYSYNYSPEKAEEEPAASQNDYHIPATNRYDFETTQAEETPTYEIETNETVSSQYESSSYEQEAQPTVSEDYSAPPTENSYSYEAPTETKEPAYAEPVETVSQSVISQPVKTRFSERNVDLPIDVAEDERRLHNDARRFARLLVSEIKLYNEQKVNEGRTSYDLYERLREAIDRSREMYDKRVQPPVAAKFDYFHYELVNSLADGDETKLGGSYPGATV